MVGHPESLEALSGDDLAPGQFYERQWRRQEGVLVFLKDFKKRFPRFRLPLGVALEEGPQPAFPHRSRYRDGGGMAARLKKRTYRSRYGQHIEVFHEMEPFGKERERHPALGTPFAVHQDEKARVQDLRASVAPAVPMELGAADGADPWLSQKVSLLLFIRNLPDMRMFSEHL